jgi:hypothetical protein
VDVEEAKFKRILKNAIIDFDKKSKLLAEDRKKTAAEAAKQRLASVFKNKLKNVALEILERP